MKISENFDIREFVPKSIWDKFKENSVWFVNKKIVEIAEFYKQFFYDHYKAKNPSLWKVLIKVNDWHYGGQKQYSGLRPADCTVGATNSQHRYKSAFDCEIILVFKDGTKKEVDYVDIHKIIVENNALFLSKGVTCVEDVSIAKGWLHTDIRWIPNQTQILVVKP